MTEDKGTYLSGMHHTVLTRDYCCAQCGGLLVHRIVTPYTQPRTVCAKDPNHEGYIRKETAFRRAQQARFDADEVAITYHLRPRREVTREEIDELFGG